MDRTDVRPRLGVPGVRRISGEREEAYRGEHGKNSDYDDEFREGEARELRRSRLGERSGNSEGNGVR